MANLPAGGNPMASPASPLAYFITFSTYGTWLHGDDRGSVQRGAVPGEPSLQLSPRPPLRSFERCEMDQPPYVLDARRREVVLNTIVEVTRHRG